MVYTVHVKLDIILRLSILTVCLLNVLDVIFSIIYFNSLNDDFSQELNPITRELLNIGYVEFAITKLILVMSGLYILSKYKKHPIAKISVLIALIVYMFVISSFVYNFIY